MPTIQREGKSYLFDTIDSLLDDDDDALRNIVIIIYLADNLETLRSKVEDEDDEDEEDDDDDDDDDNDDARSMLVIGIAMVHCAVIFLNMIPAQTSTFIIPSCQTQQQVTHRYSKFVDAGTIIFLEVRTIMIVGDMSSVICVSQAPDAYFPAVEHQVNAYKDDDV